MSDLTPDLQIFGVYDRGIPNSERIVLRVNSPVNLGQYILVLGYRGHAGADTVLPIPDQSLWLGSTYIEAPAWVFIFTGNGQPGITHEKNTHEPLHSIYWNKPNIVLTHDDIVPALLHVDFVQIGNKPNMSLTDVAEKKKSVDLTGLLQYFQESLEKSQEIKGQE